jgi:hypothetical protein
MTTQNYNKLDTKTEFKIYIIISILLITIITLDYLNIGLPCFF